MVYKTRPGIELVHICGTHLLISTRATWDVCPRVKQLSKGGALIWSMLEREKKPDTITQFLAVISRTPLDEVQERFDTLIEKLLAEGYLWIDDSDDEYGYYDKDMK